MLFLLVFMVAAFPSAAAGGASFQASGTQIIIRNPNVELAFSQANGSLLNLIDKGTGSDLISEKVGNYNGFTFSYTTPSNATPQYAGGYLARSVSLNPANVATGVQLTIQFNQFNVNGSSLNLSATLVVTVDNSSPLTTWQLSIDNRDQITIESVTLPSISGVGQISNDPGNDYLVYPGLSGILFRDPTHNFVIGRGVGYQQYYPGGYANMQFMAYYSAESGAGLYMANQDNGAYTKYLAAARQGQNWMTLGSTYVPPFQAGAGVAVPYAVTVGVFHGDWFDAAGIYRAWALQQPWAQNGPLTTRSDVPDWYKKTGMAAWTFTRYWTRLDNSPWNGAYSNLSKMAAAWQREIQSQPLLNWTGWENKGQWLGSPDFLPPSEGWASFDAAVQATHAAGGRLMMQPTTSAATIGAPSWTILESAASRQRDGSLYSSTHTGLDNNAQPAPQTNAQMDPAQQWHDAVLNFASQLGQHGIDLIHMDGNPFQGGLCFATDHAHPPGGGNWWFQSMAAIYTDVRSAGRSFNPDFAMSGEFYAEPFLNMTDSGWDETNAGLDPTDIYGPSVIDHSNVSFIPLWQAVYHDYTLTYSMFSFLDGHDAAFHRRGLALSLITGEIPMVYADTDGTYYPWELSERNQDLLGYLQRIAAFRTTYGYRFAVLGQMLRPPHPSVPSYRVPPATAIGYTLANTSAFDTPSVLSGAWQSPEGDAALVFTNISDGPVSFLWTITGADVPLTSGETYDLYVLKNGTCLTEQPGASLPYALTLDSNSTDVVTVILSQAASDGRPRFPGCGPAAP